MLKHERVLTSVGKPREGVGRREAAPIQRPSLLRLEFSDFMVLT